MIILNAETMREDNPRVRAMPESHDAIIREISNYPRGPALDCPCGSGALSLRLASAGFGVSCCDIDEGNFSLGNQLSWKWANLNDGNLPYENEEFQYVICVNGLHRVHNIDAAIGELSRVLKKSGILFLSWPNYVSTARRLKFLFTGSVGVGIDSPKYDQTIGSREANFRFPLTPKKVHAVAENHQLELERSFSEGRAVYDYLLSPLVPMILLFNMFSKLFKRYPAKNENNSFSMLLGGGTAFLFYRKK